MLLSALVGSLLLSVRHLAVGRSPGDARTVVGAEMKHAAEYVRGGADSRPPLEDPLPTAPTVVPSDTPPCRATFRVDVGLLVVDDQGVPVPATRVIVRSVPRQPPPLPRVALETGIEARADPDGRCPFQLAPGEYVASGLSADGGAGILEFSVNDRGAREDVLLQLRRPREARITLSGNQAPAARTWILFGPDPALSQERPIEPAVAGALASVPGEGDILVVACDAGRRPLGIALVAPGQARVDLRCEGEAGSWPGTTPAGSLAQSWIVGLCEGVPRVCALWDGALELPQGGAFASVVRSSGSVSWWDDGGNRGTVDCDVLPVRTRCLHAPSDVPEAWTVASVRTDVVGSILGREVLLGVDSAEADASGQCRLSVPRRGQCLLTSEGGRHLVTAWDADRERLELIAREDSVDEWTFERPRVRVTILDHKGRTLYRRTDAAGRLLLPRPEPDSVTLVRSDVGKQGKDLSAEIVAAGGGLEPLAIPAGIPGRGECRIVVPLQEGMLCAIVQAGTTAEGARDVARAVASGHVDVPLRRSGRYCVWMADTDGEPFAVVPLSLRGRGKAQVVRAAVPAGGVELPASAIAAELVAFEVGAETWEPLFRMRISERSRRMRLPRGKYLLRVHRGSALLLNEVVEVGHEMARMPERAPAQGCLVTFRAMVTPRAFALGTDIVVESPGNPPTRLVLNTGSEGKVQLTVPWGPLRAFVRWGGERSEPVERSVVGNLAVCDVPFR